MEGWIRCEIVSDKLVEASLTNCPSYPREVDLKALEKAIEISVSVYSQAIRGPKALISADDLAEPARRETRRPSL
jgi:hypothetical protein